MKLSGYGKDRHYMNLVILKERKSEIVFFEKHGILWGVV